MSRRRLVTRVTVGDVGWLEYDAAATPVRNGDVLFPPAVDVHFPSDDGSPALYMRLEVVGGAPQCRELRLMSKDPGREIRTSDLKLVTLDNWVSDLYALASSRIVAESPDGVISAVKEASEESHRAARRVIDRTRAAARRTITDDLLAQVAAVYREHIEDRPTESVRRAFQVEYRTAAKYVQLARARGLLPPTTAGRKRA